MYKFRNLNKGIIILYAASKLSIYLSFVFNLIVSVLFPTIRLNSKQLIIIIEITLQDFNLKTAYEPIHKGKVSNHTSASTRCYQTQLTEDTEIRSIPLEDMCVSQIFRYNT